MADNVAQADQAEAALVAYAKPLCSFYLELCRLGMPADDAHWFCRDVMDAWLEQSNDE